MNMDFTILYLWDSDYVEKQNPFQQFFPRFVVRWVYMQDIPVFSLIILLPAIFSNSKALYSEK